ncbi:hypothetical protein DUI87_21696 [Hirundo rustica rustica]|uniref:Uncharacterized protein n=1 Tax=Hirundo rustica rustica TaxID=333673 RepID=A0A3M0JKS9_HIRRU|nr:hypothetical protein DUI87_21696 [Hirundo rustica rustica]
MDGTKSKSRILKFLVLLRAALGKVRIAQREADLHEFADDTKLGKNRVYLAVYNVYSKQSSVWFVLEWESLSLPAVAPHVEVRIPDPLGKRNLADLIYLELSKPYDMVSQK